jgi:hypothetical protein
MDEGKIVDRIIKSLSNKQYQQENLRFITREFADLIIKVRDKTIAILEIKSKASLKKLASSFSPDSYFQFKTRYFVYTDGSEFLIFDRTKNPTRSITVNFDAFINRMSQRIPVSYLKEMKEIVSRVKQQKTKEFSNALPGLQKFIEAESYKIGDELKLSSNYVLYFDGSKGDTDSFEHKFFVNLLENNIPNTIYRYCSFNRVFQILNDNEIAMLGILGMNDTTEPSYVDNYINDSEENLWDFPPQSRAAINRRFIISCTELYDNLMQWRLYGDDAKGACIKFDMKSDLQTDERFYLGRVKYADKKGKHKELELLKGIIAEVREKTMLDIKFILLYVWRHFFKPHEYSYEKEIRLLYIHRKKDREKKWIVAEPYGIVNPMVIFNLKKGEFPFKISEVMLGPKKTERALNKSQLEQMISERVAEIKITESQRDVYR